jgi:hypothetical protein
LASVTFTTCGSAGLRSADLDMHGDRRAADARHAGVEAQQVAHRHRLLEDELVDRHGGDAPARHAVGSTAPARSTWAMIQPPKMSPLALTSAGIGITRSTSSAPSGKLGAAAGRAGGGGGGRVTSGGVFMLRCILHDIPARLLPGPLPMRRRTPPCVPMPGDAATAPRPLRLATLKRKLLPYLWRYRWRVALALAFLLAAKVANVGVPVLLKHLVDACPSSPATPGAAGRAGGPAAGLWRAAPVDLAVHRAARAGLRQGHLRRRAASRWRCSATCTR